MAHIEGITTKTPERRGVEKGVSKSRREKSGDSFEAINWESDRSDLEMALESGENLGNFTLDSVKNADGSIDDVKLENVVLAMAKSDYDVSNLSAETINNIENIAYQLQPEAGPGGEFVEYANGLASLVEKCEQHREAEREVELKKVNDILASRDTAVANSKPDMNLVFKEAVSLGFTELAGMTVEKYEQMLASTARLEEEVAKLQKKASGFGQRLMGFFGGGVKKDIQVNQRQIDFNKERIGAIARMKDQYLEAHAPASTERARSTKSDDMRDRAKASSAGSGKMVG